MSDILEPTKDRMLLEREHLQAMLDILREQGYYVVGPTLRQSAIVYDRISSVGEMPIGWTDVQEGGTYRLRKRDDGALFGYAVGPDSWKKFLFPPTLRLMRARRGDNGFQVSQEQPDDTRYAFIGVRSCELHAIAIQDRVFLHGNHVDPHYKASREAAFIVAVNCGQAGGTCFCVSMNTGPKATWGYDLALTEVIEHGRQYFVAEGGTDRGRMLLRQVSQRMATQEEVEAAEGVVQKTALNMGRTMDTSDIKELLYRNYEHPRWEDVASRCLTCANCTMVCPTCFCNRVEDSTDVTGQNAERSRRWDSCFTMDFSYIHGGSVRSSALSRYRQWMTHKLATWIDQFGTSGCVGCGRCITWCPVAIDITEEVRAIRASDSGNATEAAGGEGHNGNADA